MPEMHYIVCYPCGIGKRVAVEEQTKLADHEFAVKHLACSDGQLGGGIDVIPEMVFRQEWIKKGFTDVDDPTLQALPEFKSSVEGEKRLAHLGSAGTGVDLRGRVAPFGAPAVLRQPVLVTGGRPGELRNAGHELPRRDEVRPTPERAADASHEKISAPMRLTWDEYGLEFARTAALRGTCSRLQVGAALFDEHHQVFSTGYNGAPAGLPHCNHANGGDMENGHCIRAQHAERNCLLKSYSPRVRGATMYITVSPCLTCCRDMISAGISRIVFAQQYGPIEAQERLCASAGVHLLHLRAPKPTQ